MDNKRPDKKQKKKSSSSSSNGGGGGGGGGDSRPFKLPAGETKDVAKMYERNAVSDADREAAEVRSMRAKKLTHFWRNNSRKCIFPAYTSCDKMKLIFRNNCVPHFSRNSSTTTCGTKIRC